MKSKLVVLLLGVGAVLSGVSAYAHHSFAGTYVEDKLMSIEGTLVEFSIRNPHSFVTVEVTEKDGKTKTKWGCEWGGVTQLTESGVNRYTLKTGDKVKITGAPGRDPEDHRLLLRSLDRPSDGYHWGGTVR
jgi:hypothetical protein